jgi:hypothetical protein
MPVMPWLVASATTFIFEGGGGGAGGGGGLRRCSVSVSESRFKRTKSMVCNASLLSATNLPT